MLLSVMPWHSCKSPEKNDANIDKRPYVVVLSLDGFRWDLVDKYNLLNLKQMAQRGVKAKSLIPCYPTKTFPNHYSIATGLYPDNHGIVQNNFFAPDLNKEYSIGNKTAVKNPDFYKGEPIWATAEKQEVKSASYFWVASEAPIMGVLPSITKHYNQKLPFGQRADSVIAWLQLPEEKRPHLIMWYIHQPDWDMHDYGPESSEVEKQVRQLDSLVGAFNQKLMKLSNFDKINFIVLSDHGMGTIYENQYVLLDDYIKKDWCKTINGGNPVFIIRADSGFYDSIYFNLKKAEHLKVWKTENLPPDYHYGKNKRIGDFVVEADSAWSIYWKDSRKDFNGTHGYDNKNTDMHGIFYAYGPDFKQNYIAEPFYNIHIYPLIARILKLQPAKTDGDLNKVKSLLITRKDK